MTYADGIAQFVDRSNAVLVPDFHTRPFAEQRAMYERLAEEFPFERPAGVDVRDEVLAAGDWSVPVRVYRSAAPADGAADTGRGGLLFYHGGGFVLGSLDSHDTIAAEIAAKTGLVVVSVGYPPAPETHFPDTVDICFAALTAVAALASDLGIDPARIGVAGDSSGANLAVAVALTARDRRGPAIAAQALISPVLDFARWKSGGDDAPLLSSDEMLLFTRSYAGPDPAVLDDPLVSPLRSARFDSLPPAYVMSAEQDSLRSDAEDYAQRLTAEGVPVQLSVEPGLVHACIRARGVSAAAADAFDRWCAATAGLLSRPGRPFPDSGPETPGGGPDGAGTSSVGN